MHIAKRIVSTLLVLMICVLVVGCGDDSDQIYTSERKLAEKESTAEGNVKPEYTVKTVDFGSLNGTFLNEEKIGQRERTQTWEEGRALRHDEYTIKDGDVLRLGKQCELLCRIEAPELCAVFSALAVPGGEILAVAPYFPEYKPFAESAGLDIAADIPRSDDITKYEDMGKTVIEGDPECETAKRFFALADLLIAED